MEMMKSNVMSAIIMRALSKEVAEYFIFNAGENFESQGS